MGDNDKIDNRLKQDINRFLDKVEYELLVKVPDRLVVVERQWEDGHITISLGFKVKASTEWFEMSIDDARWLVGELIRRTDGKPSNGTEPTDGLPVVFPYPADEPDVIDLGDGHFALPVGLDGYLWHHEGPHRSCRSWGWFGARDGRESGHRIVSHDPLTVEGSLIHQECGDHGFIREGRWVRA